MSDTATAGAEAKDAPTGAGAETAKANIVSAGAAPVGARASDAALAGARASDAALAGATPADATSTNAAPTGAALSKASHAVAQGIRGKRSLFLALSTFALLFLGLIYAFSMFAAPMSAAFGLEKDAVGLTFNIMMVAFCIGAVVGSQIEKGIGVRGALMVSALMFLGGFAGTGLLANGNIAAVYLCYGVLGGLAVGIGYNSVIATTNMWFPDKVGFSSGVLMMGFGLGSLVLGTLAVSLIPAMGLSAVFAGIGIVTCIVVVALALVLRRPPARVVEATAPGRTTACGYDPGDEDAPLKSPTFYVYWVWAVVVIGIGLATIGNCASDAQIVGVDAGFATLLVGLVSTCNGVARVVIGIVYDKTDVKKTMLVDALVAVAACVCIIGALATGTPALYVAGALLCGFCYGGVPVVASAFARQRYGAKNYPLNLSLANFAIVFGSILNVIVQAIVGGTDHRMAVFTVMGVLSLVAAFDVLPFSKKWNKDLRMLEARRQQA